MWILKLGGSLADGEYLQDWLDLLAEHGGGRVVVVPGGGPFAAAVRASQRVLGFDDVTAHHMALGAMEQFGHALAALCPALVRCAEPLALATALAARRVPVWMPARMAGAAPDIPANWEMTSDSLAVWLAMRMGVRGAALVKRGPLPTRDLAELARRGVVDPLLPQWARRFGKPVVVFSAESPPRFAAQMLNPQG